MARLLDRLNIANSRGLAFQKLWQKNCELIEGQFTDILSAISSLSELAPIAIAADYQGAVDPADQLPYEVAIKRYSGDTEVTTLTAWSVAVTSGDITASIGAATGILSITAVGSSGTLTVTAVYNGITKTRLVVVTLGVAATPSIGDGGGGGGSNPSAVDTSFVSINSTTHAPISDELTVTVGASGAVALSTVLAVRTAKVGPTGSFDVWGKWEWWDGAAWQDVAGEVINGSAAEIDNEDGILVLSNGGLNVSTSKTGLTPTNSEKFRFSARKDSGTRSMSFSGTASVVP